MKISLKICQELGLQIIFKSKIRQEVIQSLSFQHFLTDNRTVISILENFTEKLFRIQFAEKFEMSN